MTKLIWMLVWVAGCKTNKPTLGPSDDTGDTEVPVVLPTPAVPCLNPAFEELGSAGSHSVDTFDFTWESGSPNATAPPFKVRIPEDTLSLAVTAATEGGGVRIETVRLDGQDISDRFNTFPYGEGTVQGSLPTNFGSDLQADVPVGGHCFRVTFAGSPELAGQPGRVHLLSRRGGDANLIDLNFVFVGGTETSMNQAQGERVLQVIHDIWSQNGGPGLGETAILSLDAGPLVSVQRAVEITASVIAPDNLTSVDVFFFADVFGLGPILGFAGGVPGVLGVDDLENSGVVILLDAHRMFNGSISADALGSTIAHEVGHQLGLHHSTESDGTSSAYYADVPVCGPANDTNGDNLVDSFECQGLGSDNFMFWTGGIRDYTVSPEQAFVLSRSAITR